MRFSKNALCCLDNGEVLAGANGKVVRITPAELFESVSPSCVIFTNLFVGNTEITPGMEGRDILKSNISCADQITLNHDDDFTLTVSTSTIATLQETDAISGRSPLEFMRIIRLRHGLTLVRQGGLTVSEVAYKVGMSPKQFAKFFKEEYGSLPSKYAKAPRLSLAMLIIS